MKIPPPFRGVDARAAPGPVRVAFLGKRPPLGNIYAAGSLDALLNSPEAIAWRQGLDTRRDAICKKCVCTLSLREPNGE